VEGKRDLVVVLAGRLVVVAADDLNEAEVGTRGLVGAEGQIVVVVAVGTQGSVVAEGQLVVVVAVGTRGLVVAAGQIVVVVGMTLSHLAESLVEADLDHHSLKMIAPPPCSSSRC